MVRALLADLVFTRSKAERIVMQIIRDAGFPTPRVNHPIDGDEIDFVFEELMVTLEVDGFTFHATRRAFERDRRRDADRQRAGHVVVQAPSGGSVTSLPSMSRSTRARLKARTTAR